MAKRKAISGSGIINTIVQATNKVAKPELPFVNQQTFGNFAKALASAPDSVQNAFMENLTNLGFLQKFVSQREFESYFRKLYGEDILEDQMVLYAVDTIKARAFDPDDVTRFLENHPPRVGQEFIQSSLKRQYQLSTLEDVITAIGQGEGYFLNFYNNCVTAMWNSYEHDNLIAIKEMINEQIEAGNLRLVPVTTPTDQASVLAMKVEVDTIASDWESDLTREYNVAGYNTHTPESELFYLFNNRINALNSNYNLAWAFNEAYLDLKKDGRAISMDSKGLAGGNVYAAIFDKTFFEIHNRIGHPRVTSFMNPATLAMNRILTCFTLYGMNLFANSAWFIAPSAVGIESMTLDTRSGSKNANPGDVVEIYVDSVTATSGKYADKFGKFQLHDVTVTDPDTYVDPDSGELYLGKNETGVELDGLEGKYVRVYCFSHLDENVYGEILIKINQ